MAYLGLHRRLRLQILVSVFLVALSVVTERQKSFAADNATEVTEIRKAADPAAVKTIHAISVDDALSQENQLLGVVHPAEPAVPDLAFIRRISLDLVGRIPSKEEVDEFLAWPEHERRERMIEKRMNDDRFVDRWTTFYADLLRLRSNSEGGSATIAYVHRSLSNNVPYDELCRNLISKNGKAGAVPEVGFILGDGADPMAMAGVTAQVFLGVRVACAQCHDHPFDVWKRKDFYELAAFYGKTRRVESQFTKTIYTTEANESLVLWPPEGVGKMEDRKPITPRFPFELLAEDHPSVVRLNTRRKALAEEKAALLAQQEAASKPDDGLDDLLANADKKVERSTRANDREESLEEARSEVRKIGASGGRNLESAWRMQLAEQITSPRNRYFSRCFVNRVWCELIGRGFVNPLDDFNQTNPPSHPQTLDFLADEFVASGYDLRSLVSSIVSSEVYQRGHSTVVDEKFRGELEKSFLALPARRMNSESLYDSIVTAGHLFEVKHAAGKNMKTVWSELQVTKQPSGGQGLAAMSLTGSNGQAMDGKMAASNDAAAEQSPVYNLEGAIELDFAKILEEVQEGNDEVVVEQMSAMSTEQIEAERMLMKSQENSYAYIERFTRQQLDDNPLFASSFRMASPADPEHFLRVFGQPERVQLGETRDHAPSMRQALMLLNGRLSHEAARVGELEPTHALLIGPQQNLGQAVELAYLEILTRRPSTSEALEGVEMVNASGNPQEGMGDLRWILLNCNEFRFVP
ncbi:MAG: DUF1553 domain-containing protein [Planctomycetota bacterium]|nr:MAG: DUF1553 domain-containing protein [Planctomycetota bacterium]